MCNFFACNFNHSISHIQLKAIIRTLNKVITGCFLGYLVNKLNIANLDKVISNKPTDQEGEIIHSYLFDESVL